MKNIWQKADEVELPEMDELFDNIDKQPKDWLNPSNSPEEPAFWITEIRLLSGFSTDADALIRSIPLKKGLNIVWSEGGRVGGPEDERGRGHGAGKTAFCRAVRYLLGEKHYGNRFIRERMAENRFLKRAYITGEIQVEGCRWGVVRSLYPGGRQFAVQNTGIDGALNAPMAERVKHDEFIKILESSIVSRLPVREFGTEGKHPIQWGHILQALARDQEAHLSSLHRWRDPASASEPEEMSEADRAFLMRCLFGIAEQEEGRKLRTRGRIHQDITNYRATIETYRRVSNDLIEELQKHFPNVGIPTTPEDSLFVERVTTEARKQATDEINKVKRHIEDLDISGLEEEENRLRRESAKISGRIEERVDLLQSLETKLKSHQQKENPTVWDEEDLREYLLAALSRPGLHCSVPVDTAMKECPLYWRLGIQEALKDDPVQDYSLDMVNQYQRQIANLNREVQPYQDKISAFDEEADKKEAEKNEARNRKRKLEERIDAVDRKSDSKSRIAENLLDSLGRIEKARSVIKENEKALSMIDVAIDEIREKTKQRQTALSEIFDAIIQSIAGKRFSGRLNFTKIENNAAIYRFNELESEAYKALKALAFDFTAMLATFHEIGHHPGFLIHDSPRESDLEPSLYHPFFDFVDGLERNFPNSFQYIVTTTENPPKYLQTSPPVCAKLDSSNEEGFLYGNVL